MSGSFWGFDKLSTRKIFDSFLLFVLKPLLFLSVSKFDIYKKGQKTSFVKAIWTGFSDGKGLLWYWKKSREGGGDCFGRFWQTGSVEIRAARRQWKKGNLCPLTALSIQEKTILLRASTRIDNRPLARWFKWTNPQGFLKQALVCAWPLLKAFKANEGAFHAPIAVG